MPVISLQLFFTMLQRAVIHRTEVPAKAEVLPVLKSMISIMLSLP